MTGAFMRATTTIIIIITIGNMTVVLDLTYFLDLTGLVWLNTYAWPADIKRRTFGGAHVPKVHDFHRVICQQF